MGPSVSFEVRTEKQIVCCSRFDKTMHLNKLVIPRPPTELIRSLRVTLQKIEANFTSPEDEPNIAELKRILLLRIADMEALEALQEAQSGEAVPKPIITAAEGQPVESLVEQSLQPSNTNETE